MVRMGTARLSGSLAAKYFGFLMTVMGTLTAPARAADAVPSPSLKLGVSPYLAATTLERMFAPVADDLGQALGRTVRFRTADKFMTFEGRLQAGEYEIAFVPALSYVKAVDEFGYVPLACMGEEFVAIVVVPESSQIRSAADLRDKLIATPPTAVSVAVALVRDALAAERMIAGRDYRMKEFKSPEACMEQLLIEGAQACVVTPMLVPGFEAKRGVKLRTVLQSRGVANMAFVVHRRVSERERNLLLSRIVGWSDSPAGRKLLERLNSRGFGPIADKDYDQIRALMKRRPG